MPIGILLCGMAHFMAKEQIEDIERVQVVCLKVALGPKYENYSSALNYTSLRSLESRRDHKSLQFGLRCLQHPKHKEMFPLNEDNLRYPTRSREIFLVNRARTEYYKNSSIIFIQKKLNEYFMNKENAAEKKKFLAKHFPNISL